MPTRTGSRARLYGPPPTERFTKMETRPQSRAEYHTARWTRESREFKKSNPLCKRCQAKGKIKATEITDHIIPVEIHFNFWDKTNWQGLCKTCNIEKGNEDKKLINEYRKRNKPVSR